MSPSHLGIYPKVGHLVYSIDKYGLLDHRSTVLYSALAHCFQLIRDPYIGRPFGKVPRTAYASSSMSPDEGLRSLLSLRTYSLVRRWPAGKNPGHCYHARDSVLRSRKSSPRANLRHLALWTCVSVFETARSTAGGDFSSICCSVRARTMVNRERVRNGR